MNAHAWLWRLLLLKRGKPLPEDVADSLPTSSGDVQSISRSLTQQGLLTEDERKEVEAELASLLAQENNDPERALASLIRTLERSGVALFDGEWRSALLDAKTVVDPDATVSAAPTSSDVAPTVVAPSLPFALAEGEEPLPAVEEFSGRYEEKGKFAEGGMGRILRVYDRHLSRDVAFKQLLPERAGVKTQPGTIPTTRVLSVPMVARFFQEARITGQLEHPSIVPVYELGYRKDGSLYYTMKLVRGVTLEEKIRTAKTLQERCRLLPHFLDVCNALAYAHSRGVIHRDIKPLNIMIGEFGETVVLDWGIAKVKGTEDVHAAGLERSFQALRTAPGLDTVDKTQYGQTLGSPYYMPPEQARGRIEEVDERSDVYALGAVLYTILVGKPPYYGMKVREFLEKVEHFAPQPPRRLEPNAPPELCAICERAMQRKTVDRYPSAKALAEDVERFLTGGLVSAYEYSFGELARRFIRKHKGRIAAIAGVLLLCLGIGVASYVRIRMERDRALAAERAAVEARNSAEEARRRAEQERQNAERELYYSSMGLAQRSITEQRLEQARRLLEGAPVQHRDWEWGYLLGQAYADAQTFDGAGRLVGFLPEASGVVLVSTDGTVTVQRGQHFDSPQVLAEKMGFGAAFTLSQDGARLAACGNAYAAVWNTADGRVVYRFEQPNYSDEVKFTAFSEDGTTLAFVDNAKALHVIRVDTEEEVYTEPVTQLQGFALGLSRSGRYLLVARRDFGMDGWECAVTVWDLAQKARVGEAHFPDPLSVHAVRFSPNERYLALGTDASLEVYTVTPWTHTYTLSGRFRYPDTLAFSPGSVWLAAGDKDGNVAIYSMTTGDGNVAPKAHEDAVRYVTFNHAGTLCATAGEDRTVRLWHVSPPAPALVLRGHERLVTHAAFSPDDGWLLSSAFDGKAKRWDLRSDFLWRRDIEKITVATAGHVFAGAAGTVVRVWDSVTGARLAELSAHAAPVFALAINADGTRVASVANEDGRDVIRVWNVGEPSASPLTLSESGATGTNALRFLDARNALLVRRGTTLDVYNLSDGTKRGTLADADDFAVSSDERRIALSGKPDEQYQAKVTLVSLDTLEPETAFTVETRWAAHLAFSPDNTRLYVGTHVGRPQGSAGPIHVYDISAGKVAGTLSGHTRQVTCFAFREDGTPATGSTDGSVIVWDIGAATPKVRLEGHASNVNDLVFSPSGKRIVTASQDGTFKLWDAENGREILTLQAEARHTAGEVPAPDRVVFQGDRLFTLTNAPILPPFMHDALPYDINAYPGTPETPLPSRIYAYKRQNSMH